VARGHDAAGNGISSAVYLNRDQGPGKLVHGTSNIATSPVMNFPRLPFTLFVEHVGQNSCRRIAPNNGIG
jgi:hypothetical protein